MFYYFGTKHRLAKLYPAPVHDTIIEPFAGAAAYSLHGRNWEKNVILFDPNPQVKAAWDFLLSASAKDILDLPVLKTGEKLTDFGLSDGQKALLGFVINPGSSRTKNTAGNYAHKWIRRQKDMAENIHKIKHWKIFQSGYDSAPSVEATWFVDPPYQVAGAPYFGFKDIDYKALGEWCLSRQGQLIVCENLGATWLPFSYLSGIKGVRKISSEAVFIR